MRKEPETRLEKVFGSSAFFRVVDVLLTHPSADYSRKELAEAANVAEKTLYQNWETFEELDIVEETRKYGKSQLYRLNPDSEVARLIFELDEELRDRLEEVEWWPEWSRER
ncbi:MAG: hypothetical protein SVS85_03125 [Candidatus Nanohaloarchaea archaeon]|nr:hypothetical protein [Candidatus Nanohaloarchaea archaeon]